MHAKDLLGVHPEDQTDAFTLYIKGTILITKVKDFNRRFRLQNHIEYSSAINSSTVSSLDPWKYQAFKELDSTFLSLRDSFPAHLKNPIDGNIVDLHLYVATLLPLA